MITFRRFSLAVASIIVLLATYNLIFASEEKPATQTQTGSTGSTTVTNSDAATETKTVAAPLIFPGEKHFANMKQLTFEGENAEAYFNSDGTQLILQRHVEAGTCDQIYIMDLKTEKMNLVSTGDGVTTCSYFIWPKNDKIVYSSTHMAGVECPAPVNRMKGYVWKLHPEFDIFEANPDGSDIVQLTNTPGYDAEPTCAPDGSLLVYCSFSSGDPEIWTMKTDGSCKTQLTDKLGYDGGPFFSWDSKKIVWRAFYPQTEEEKEKYLNGLKDDSIAPMPLQLWTMNADGTDKKQVTNNGKANFCPFFAPDDKRIIFASNMNGKSPMDFNLWIINVDGTGLEQLTTFAGFDAFPMFSPDGKKLVFGSNRNNRIPTDTNLFICDWVE